MFLSITLICITFIEAILAERINDSYVNPEIESSTVITYPLDSFATEVSYQKEALEKKTNDSSASTTATRDSYSHNSTKQPIQIPNFNANLCQDRICVMKCCQHDEMMLGGHTCIPLVHGNRNWSVDLYNNEIQKDVMVQYSFPLNPTSAACIVVDRHDFVIQQTGLVYYPKRQELVDHLSYCLDQGWEEENGDIEAFGALCIKPIRLTSFMKTTRKIEILGQIISCVCLAFILALHLPIKATKNLQDKSFICLCLCLFCSLFILAINKTEKNGKTIQYGRCVAMAISSQFFFLSFNFWLTIMCYDILRIIRGTAKMVPLSELSGSSRRFAAYCSISFGAPSVISLCTVIMQSLPDDVIPPKIRPGIGNNRCWFEEDVIPLAIYFYGYQVILHILNIVFMGGSGIILYKVGAAFQCRKRRNGGIEGEMMVHNRSSLKIFWEQFAVFLLFVILWGFDSLSLLYSKENFWAVFNILNTLQGFFLLLIVFRSSRKRKMFRESWGRASTAVKDFSENLKPRILQLNPLKERSSVSSNETELQTT